MLQYWDLNLNKEFTKKRDIQIADAVLEFDPINEAAIRFKCKSLVKMGKHSLAKSTFDAFAEEYRALYGEKYKESFKVLIG